MRLTLRTMLAYLDDLLDPSNAQDLGRKIEESDLASSLVGRIRDVSRRLRLGAPKLTGRGMGLDPNTVAEYLDNTLSVARVPDFEKICLESDMHLAEVACSHQILALVLGGPAEVNPATRQRMYKLIARPEEATFAIAPGVPEKPAAPTYPPRKKRKVPEYLRDEPARFPGWLKAVAAVLVLAGLAGAVLMAVGPFNRSTEVAQVPRQPGAGAAQSAVAVVPGGANATRSISSRNPAEVPENHQSPVDSTPAVDEGALSVEEAMDSEGADADATAEAVAESTDAAPVEGPTTPTATTGSNVAPGGESDSDLATDSGNSATLTADAGAGEPVGRYDSANSVLLHWQGDQNGWMRVPSQANLSADEQLLSLPMFRSSLTLGAGVTMEMVGETQVRLLAPATPEVPSIEIDYGRLVLMTAGRPGAQISITIGSLKGTLTLAEATSVVGVEVHPSRADGTDPESEQPVYNLDLYIGSGQVVWMDASKAAPETFTGPQHWSWPIAVAEEAATQIPQWVLDVDSIDAVDRNAASAVAANFALDRPGQLVLKEIAEDRRVEFRKLAVAGLAAIGNYDALVKSLNNEANRALWRDQVDELQVALAQGSESAARVRASIDRQRGARSPQLYRMLWGFTEAQLKSGAAAELVEFLNDDKNLDVRVVAFCTLERIAGKGLNYRPADNPKSRQNSLQSWRQWAKTYQSTPPAAVRP